MLIIKYTLTTKASPEDIWNIWQDAKNWNIWDNNTEYYFLDGPFQEGTKGVWKPKEGPPIQITLTRVEPFKLYVGEAKLFLARLISSHYLTKSDGKTQVTQQFEIKGPLAFLFVYHLGPKLKKDLLLEMESLIKKAESSSKI